MDADKLPFFGAVSMPTPLEQLDRNTLRQTAETAKSSPSKKIKQQKYERVAKDFESVLLTKLLDEMKNTVGDWGFEADGASKQLQGMFWLYLARDVANKGGFGLWKDIYNHLTAADAENDAGESLDRTL